MAFGIAPWALEDVPDDVLLPQMNMWAADGRGRAKASRLAQHRARVAARS